MARSQTHEKQTDEAAEKELKRREKKARKKAKKEAAERLRRLEQEKAVREEEERQRQGRKLGGGTMTGNAAAMKNERKRISGMKNHDDEGASGLRPEKPIVDEGTFKLLRLIQSGNCNVSYYQRSLCSYVLLVPVT
jgi:hypothetical protein